MISLEETPEDGEVSLPRKLTIGYFRQDVEEMAGRTLWIGQCHRAPPRVWSSSINVRASPRAVSSACGSTQTGLSRR